MGPSNEVRGVSYERRVRLMPETYIEVSYERAMTSFQFDQMKGQVTIDETRSLETLSRLSMNSWTRELDRIDHLLCDLGG